MRCVREWGNVLGRCASTDKQCAGGLGEFAQDCGGDVGEGLAAPGLGIASERGAACFAGCGHERCCQLKRPIKTVRADRVAAP